MYAFSQPGRQKNKTQCMTLNMLPVEYFTSQLLTQVRPNKWRMPKLNRWTHACIYYVFFQGWNVFVNRVLMDFLSLNIKTLILGEITFCLYVIRLCKRVNRLWLWHLQEALLPGWSGAVGTTVSVGLDGDGTVVKDEVSVWLEMVAAGIVGRKLVTSSTWDSKITALSREPRE